MSSDTNELKQEFLDGLLGILKEDELRVFVLDFLVEKCLFVNGSIEYNNIKLRKVDNAAIKQVYNTVERALTKELADTKSQVVSENVQNDVVFSGIKDIASLPKQIFAGPLFAKNVLVGHIVLYAEQDMTQLIEFICWACKKTSVVIERIQAYQGMRNSAITDALTGLHNRGYFEVWGAKLVADARVDQSSTSLFLFDIDDFKRFNDAYGHLDGDNVLQKVSEIVHQSVPNDALACRYGGEEFVVLLPKTKSDVAMKIAEHIRTNISEAVPTTISGGVISCLNSSVSLLDLVKEADVALYRAKALGKNNIVQLVIVDKHLGVIDVAAASSVGKT